MIGAGTIITPCAVGNVNGGTFVVGVPVGMCDGSYLSSVLCKLHSSTHRMMSSFCLCLWPGGSCT